MTPDVEIETAVSEFLTRQYDHPAVNAARSAIVAARDAVGLTTAETLALVVAGFGRVLAPESFPGDLKGAKP